ncbi:MAG: hypothetical protein ACRDJW_03230 [Thermomicrobiales bacterium]
MAMIDPTIMAQLKRDGLLRGGHFAFRSGRHSEILLNRDLLLADPLFASHMGYTIAKRFFTDKIEVVASPSIWGAGLAQWVGYFLDPKAKVVYATPRNGDLTLASQLEGLINDRRILLIDNLMVSGETMTKFAGTIEALGGTVIGIGTLWNVGVEQVAGRPVFGLINTLYDAFEAADCPVCAGGKGQPEMVDY